ncbi:MAG: NAD(P)-dependent oxidoreductase [Thaumarchaeota archaeon]|nr:MAG: NAD(P)-dependent oxidoreductase [Nitrososphaerota archaeon]
MRVLVTGANGMVGRNLLDYLSTKGVETIPTDLSGLKLSGNLLEKDFVDSLESLDFDAIVHLAAVTDIKKTIENPQLCYEVNCFGTLNVLELAVKKRAKRFIFSSSANVFGVPKKLPVTEESPFDPRVPYDYSKVIGEQLVMSYLKNRGLPVAITRSWLLFGEHDQPTRATIRFIRACLSNEPLTLYNGGRDTTAPSHAANYAKLVLTILQNDGSAGEAFNFGGEKVVKIRELAQMIKRLTNSSSEVILAPPRSELEREPQVSYPSNRKVEKVLGYRNELSLEEGLKRTIQWVRGGER